MYKASKQYLANETDSVNINPFFIATLFKFTLHMQRLHLLANPNYESFHFLE